MPKPAHSGPDTSHSGRIQKVSPSTSAAFVPAAAVVLRHVFQQASVTPALELDVVAAAHSVSVLEAAFEWRSGSERAANEAETGPVTAAGCAVTVTVAVVGPGVAAGSGADPEFEFVPAEGVPLPVEAAPADSTLPSDCPAPDMAARTPSGAEVVGPVVHVATEAVLGVEAAIEVVQPHRRHFDLGCHAGRPWDHLVAAVYTPPQHLDTCHILPGHIRLGSTHKAEAGQRADHNQVVAVREHATLRPGT